jgi:leucyl-tRNA synthetase
MFIGPFDQVAMWSDDSLNGVYRFVNKIYSLFGKVDNIDKSAKDIQVMHKAILEVTERIDQMKFYTAVSSLMTFSNYLSSLDKISASLYETFLRLLSPFAPHLAEEMWARLGHNTLIVKETWPVGDVKLAIENTVTIAVQINGKMRGTIEVERDLDKDEVIKIACSLDNVSKQLSNTEPKKIIVVPNRIVNIVL